MLISSPLANAVARSHSARQQIRQGSFDRVALKSQRPRPSAEDQTINALITAIYGTSHMKAGALEIAPPCCGSLSAECSDEGPPPPQPSVRRYMYPCCSSAGWGYENLRLRPGGANRRRLRPSLRKLSTTVYIASRRTITRPLTFCAWAKTPTAYRLRRRIQSTDRGSQNRKYAAPVPLSGDFGTGLRTPVQPRGPCRG